jgi:hypothetical protein
MIWCLGHSEHQLNFTLIWAAPGSSAMVSVTATVRALLLRVPPIRIASKTDLPGGYF